MIRSFSVNIAVCIFPLLEEEVYIDTGSRIIKLCTDRKTHGSRCFRTVYICNLNKLCSPFSRNCSLTLRRSEGTRILNLIAGFVYPAIKSAVGVIIIGGGERINLTCCSCNEFRLTVNYLFDNCGAGFGRLVNSDNFKVVIVHVFTAGLTCTKQ